MGYAEHDDETGVEATRAFLAFGPAYPEAGASEDSASEDREHPTGRPLAERLWRLRPDRLVLAGGSLAAAVAVTIAFATAGSSAPIPPRTAAAHTAATHAARPACVSPALGR